MSGRISPKSLVTSFLRITALFLGLIGITFSLVRLTGNPLALALGDRLSEDELARRIEAAGLSEPIEIQFLDYLSAVVNLDFGESVLTGESVSQLFSKAFVATFEIALPSLCLGLPLAYALAFAAIRWFPKALQEGYGVILVAIYALPAFVVSLLFKFAASELNWNLPLTGRLSTNGQIFYSQMQNRTGFIVFDAFRVGEYWLLYDALRHLFLPVMTLTLVIAVTLSRIFFLQLKAALQESFIVGARAKGLSDSRIVWSHATKVSLPGIIAISGIEIAAVVTGSIYVENSFEIRGLGHLLVASVSDRDYPIVQGLVLIIGITVLAINLLANLLTVTLDPRLVRDA